MDLGKKSQEASGEKGILEKVATVLGPPKMQKTSTMKKKTVEQPVPQKVAPASETPMAQKKRALKVKAVEQ
jgi:hypothetical protein